MERDILYELKSLEKEIMRESFKHEHKHDAMPTSHVQFKIFHYLLKNSDRDVYQGELETVTDIRKSTLSGIINTMKKNNIIIKKDSEIDQRKKVICLTKKAKDKDKIFKKNIKEISEKILKDIPEDKLKVFYEVIELMKNNINSN